ncbi:thiamine transport system ATP-binding protein [Barrientosiimonas humi]|uniref:ABC-type quaternary amine transporter n=1 Tax=Barrientosiimonas humi TaxID=999931 RepID=A0A542XFF7_9MICO|nr:ABC transporter ATP-binding protein [Barrientosiimonas humi]TQL34548.1 thiamine transport system ATP-binding protein [Barrientosiimonas humi]CAG7574538.1 Spermidine/putrescine import ATP-binding protein PotA [Barrientosiimonas humi]
MSDVDGSSARPGASLQVDGVTVRFERTAAVDDVSLQLEPGRVLAVLGPSGSGKSTLLRVVAGLQRPDSGRVIIGGDDVTDVPTHRRRVALMFQDGQLFPHQDVAGNVAYALRRQGLSRAEAAGRVGELLELVGLPGMERRRPGTLSGGQQQRVALARALAARPRLLLLDEPLSALDRALRDRLGADLRQILTTSGTTAMLVTHDHDEAFTLADRMAVMSDGRIVQEGPTADVWRAPADEQIAEFLGFSTVLEGEAAARLVPGVARLALRPQALRRADDGEHRATVLGAALGADVVRLRVRLADGVEADAVAELGEPLPEPGESVRLRLVPAAAAPLPG